MSINLEIALRIDLEIEMTVPRDLRQHVIEKRNSCRNIVRPVPSRFRLTRISVSFVLRDFEAIRGFIVWSPKHYRERAGTDCFRPGFRSRLSSNSSATGMRSHPAPAHPEHTAHQTNLERSARSASEKLAFDGNTSTAGRFRSSAATRSRSRMSVVMASCQNRAGFQSRPPRRPV